MNTSHRNSKSREAEMVVNRSKLALGTIVNIKVIYSDIEKVDRVIKLAFDEIERIENLMSVYNEGSEISRLNKNGAYKNASNDTIQVLKKAIFYSEMTDGVFDISVLPAIRNLEKLGKDKHGNSHPKLSKFSRLISYKDIIIERNDIRFYKKGMAITLGGIGKGYAIDRVIEILRDHSVDRATVNAGGDIRVIGGSSDKVPWKIGVRNPKSKKRLISVIGLRNRAVATSGTYQRHFNDIYDPKHKSLSKGILSTSVISERAVDADALSTCLHLLGIDKGISLIEKLDKCGALFVLANGKLFESTFWSKMSLKGVRGNMLNYQGFRKGLTSSN